MSPYMNAQRVQERQEHLYVFLGCNVHPPISKSNDQSQISEITNELKGLAREYKNQ